MKRFIAAFVAIAMFTASFPAAGSEGSDAPNNGTDPTRLTRSAALIYEHNDVLPDFGRDSLKFDFIQPFGVRQDYSVRLRVPFVSTDVTSDTGVALGDVSIQGTHVFGLTRRRGLVVQGEMIFDTASRPELGSGKHVFKGTFIFARFLQRGIFAPAAVHSVSVGGDSGRADVNSTTFDFYYVPKLADPRTFITLDPAITVDWENDKEFLSFAATVGRTLGAAFGGVSQVYVKPSIFGGSDRPGDWGVEVGLKVLGF